MPVSLTGDPFPRYGLDVSFLAARVASLAAHVQRWLCRELSEAVGHRQAREGVEAVERIFRCERGLRRLPMTKQPPSGKSHCEGLIALLALKHFGFCCRNNYILQGGTAHAVWTELWLNSASECSEHILKVGPIPLVVADLFATATVGSSPLASDLEQRVFKSPYGVPQLGRLLVTVRSYTSK